MKTSRYIMVGIALIATAATLSHAQNIVRVHVDASTSLEQVLGDDWADIDSLIVTGQASSDDLKMLRRCIYDGATTGVDLSQCSVPQNVLPDAAFMAEFKPDETGALQDYINQNMDAGSSMPLPIQASGPSPSRHRLPVSGSMRFIVAAVCVAI